MEKFIVTTTDITLKNHHPWDCPVYVLGEILQGNIAALTKWEPRSYTGIYIGHSSFHVVSVALVINPVTGHISPQFHVVFDDECSTVPFMREVTIPPKFYRSFEIYLTERCTRGYFLKNTWFTPYLEEDTR